MGRKHVTPEKQVIVDGNMGGNLTSIVTDVEQLDRITYDVNFIGTPQGLLEVQISNDKNRWITLPIDPTLSMVGVAGNHFIDITNINWKYSRLVFTFTGGAGTLQAYFKGHSDGA